MSAEFDTYAKSYDELLKDPIRDRFARDSLFFHLRKWLLLRAFLSGRSPGCGELRWLDVGCGKGELLRLGRESFKEAIGCDPSLEMLKECAGLNVAHQPQTVSLPFGAQRFDLVTAVCVYHHLGQEERLALTADVRRVIPPGGIFAVFEHNPWNPATRLIVSRTPVDANAQLLTASQVRRIMRKSGLEPIETRYYLYFPQRLYRFFAGVENLLAPIPAGGQYAVFARKMES